jgi:hypothetical protein
MICPKCARYEHPHLEHVVSLEECFVRMQE